MTTGQILFYSGVGLLGLTVVLAIIFAIKKPQYKPGNVVYSAADGNTQKLRNGYPTDPLTIRRKTGAAGAGAGYEETERIAVEQTEKISDTGVSQETELIDGQSTEMLAGRQLTERLSEEADPSAEPTELL